MNLIDLNNNNYSEGDRKGYPIKEQNILLEIEFIKELKPYRMNEKSFYRWNSYEQF